MSRPASGEAGATLAADGKKLINLGLQGGGAHGAFTWGVLDRLLADGRIQIESVTGASAGAMNAVVLAQGLVNGSHEEARETLRRFWMQISDAAARSPLGIASGLTLPGWWGLAASPVYTMLDLTSRVISPYQMNPFNLNPLRGLLSDMIDFDKVRANNCLDLFISATNVETGRARVFRKAELTVDHLLASACLPTFFQAVEIDGVPYWDGGYMGNPPLWPLFEAAASDDVVIVQINPFFRKGAPRDAPEINDRMTEIGFNSSLMSELRSIDFVSRLIEDGRLEETGYRRVLVHMIGDEKTLVPLGASSKFNTSKPFLDMLFKAGEKAAEKWLHAHFTDIGHRSTLDIRAIFQGEEHALDGERLLRPHLKHKPSADPA